MTIPDLEKRLKEYEIGLANLEAEKNRVERSITATRGAHQAIAALIEDEKKKQANEDTVGPS